MIETLRCLLWDVDGTMVDTTALIAAALDFVYRKHFHRTLPYDERRALIGTPLKKQIRIFGELDVLGVDEQTITSDFIEYYETHRTEERILNAVTSIVIEGKRRGLPTGLVTSKNREELTNTLPRLGIVDYVDVAITADDVTQPKPYPEGLLLALQRLVISRDQAKNAVYIGDTVHDMRAARAAGVLGIAVTWGAASRNSLEAEAPAFLCDTSEQLRRLLFGKSQTHLP